MVIEVCMCECCVLCVEGNVAFRFMKEFKGMEEFVCML